MGGQSLDVLSLNETAISAESTELQNIQKLLSSTKTPSISTPKVIVPTEREQPVIPAFPKVAPEDPKLKKQVETLAAKYNVGGPEEKTLSLGEALTGMAQKSIQNTLDSVTASFLTLTQNLFSPNEASRIGSSILPGGVIVSKFGDRIDPITKKQAFHSGIDIKAASGQAIPAYDYGIVTKLAQDKDYGKNMIVNYPALHTFFRYAHLKDYGKNIYEGQTLAPNQEIGYVGNTGRSTGPHLHLEVIRGNVNPTFKNINREDYINPELFLKEQSNKKKLAEIKEKINTQSQTNMGGRFYGPFNDYYDG